MTYAMSLPERQEAPGGGVVSPGSATPDAPAPPIAKSAGPQRMPKPEFKRPPKVEPAPPAKKYAHPKFGEGALVSQDGEGPEAKLTIRFESGPKTLLARYVTLVSE